jgi:hypothetical protein
LRPTSSELVKAIIIGTGTILRSLAPHASSKLRRTARMSHPMPACPTHRDRQIVRRHNGHRQQVNCKAILTLGRRAGYLTQRAQSHAETAEKT